MTSRKYFFILLAVFLLLLGLIIGGTVGGNMILQKKSRELTDLKTENKAIEAQQTALTQAKKDVERNADIEKIVKAVVPQDKDQAKTVREIVNIAKRNGIPIKSIAFPSSTLGDKAPVATPAPSTEGGEAGSSTKPATPSITQVKPVDGIPGVYMLEIQVASSDKVSYESLLSFLRSLETNRRTAHVTGINLKPDPKSQNRLDFNLTLNAYIKP